jgi:hypothetical protein
MARDATVLDGYVFQKLLVLVKEPRLRNSSDQGVEETVQRVPEGLTTAIFGLRDKRILCQFVLLCVSMRKVI